MPKPKTLDPMKTLSSSSGNFLNPGNYFKNSMVPTKTQLGITLLRFPTAWLKSSRFKAAELDAINLVSSSKPKVSHPSSCDAWMLIADNFPGVDSTTRLVFIVQGRIFLEDLGSNVPKHKSRGSLLSVLQHFMRIARSLLQTNHAAIPDSKAPDTMVFQSLSAGDSFAVVDEVLGQQLGDAPLTYCDQVAVSSEKPCWTVEFSGHDNVSALCKKSTLNAILAKQGPDEI